MTRLWLWLAALVTVTLTVYAQGAPGVQGPDWFRQANPVYDGRYAFVRLHYGDALPGCDAEGPGWYHDYPKADHNLMRILTHLTRFDARVDSSLILRPDDPELTQYPVAYLSEPGCWQPTEVEAQALRAYLLKGGFLIVDDFNFPQPPRMVAGRRNFEVQIKRVLPEGKLVPIDVTDPVFKVFFDVAPLVRDFPRFGSATEQPEFRGVYEGNDPRRRLLVVANYNNDIGDYWEWSATGFGPVKPGTDQAYQLGVNYMLYGVTH